MSNFDQSANRGQVSSDAFLGLTSAFRDREGVQYIALIRDASQAEEISQIESHAEDRISITCPQILRCVDYQTITLASETKQFKFVYQHPGTPLSTLRRVKNPGPDVLESLLKAGLEALTYLEESKRSYHGMISPDCLYLSEEGKWRLALHPWNKETPENKLLDKAILELPIYVSPETFAEIVARNYSFRLNGIKSDLFSLGLCVLEFGLDESIESIYTRSGADQKSLIWFIKKFERKFASSASLCKALVMSLEWFEEFRPSPREVLEVLGSASAPTPSTVSTPPASPAPFASPKPDDFSSQAQRVPHQAGRSLPPQTQSGPGQPLLFQPRFQNVSSAQQNSAALRFGVAPRVASGSASALPSRREGESPRVQTYSALNSSNNTSSVSRQYNYSYQHNEPFTFTSVPKSFSDPFTFTSVPKVQFEPYISTFNPTSVPASGPATYVPQGLSSYSQTGNLVNTSYAYDRSTRQDFSSSSRNFAPPPLQTTTNWTSTSQPPSAIHTSSQTNIQTSTPLPHSSYSQDYRSIHFPIGPTRTGVYKVVGNEVFDEIIDSTEEIRDGQKYIIRKPVWIQRSSS